MPYQHIVDLSRQIRNSLRQVNQKAHSLDDFGPAMQEGRSITAVLFVHPDGDGSDGLSWDTAYTTIQDALDACSTDANDLTLIKIAPQTGATNYDIDTTGDPTWSCNVILAGSHRTWVKIKNTHESATSIMKFTGLVSLWNLNFNLGSGSVDGVKIEGPAWRVRHCQFVGEDLTGAAVALTLGNGTTTRKNGIVDEVFMVGHPIHMTGIYLNKCSENYFKNIHIHDCGNGVQIIHADSDSNYFDHIDIGDCLVGLNLDAGNGQEFDVVHFHGNATNIDDEVGDHFWNNLIGEFPISLEPDNFNGVTVATHANPDTWGGDTEVRATATSLVPFKIVGIVTEADASEKFRLRLSDDNGTSFFKDLQFEGENNVTKRQSFSFTTQTDFVFNAGTRISASAKSESGGANVLVWIQVQEI